MTILGRLDRWRAAGLITELQHNTIAPLVRKDRFSVFIELNALLYLGVLSFVAGLAWVAQSYFATLGDAVILSALTLVLGVSFYYCFSKALPYSSGEVESPNLAFDYVLYLGCLVFGVELGYMETRFHLLEEYWDFYLLFSSVLFFVLAYRFDNRFVLSLGLSSLAGWFGLRISRMGFVYGASLRPYAIAYGFLVAGAGTWFHTRDIKRHFTETYFHLAANVLFIALLSGVIGGDRRWPYLAGVLGLGAATIIEGVRLSRFAFVVYGTIYSYVGVSSEVLRHVDEKTLALGYFVVSGSLVVLAMVLLARRFGREE
ncbi:MAG TPA: DUF2157 domain-containing protein [Terriglobia bacterium]|nr:DUF2157 domain-containing protein [Terriglobia bacterium]